MERKPKDKRIPRGKTGFFMLRFLYVEKVVVGNGTSVSKWVLYERKSWNSLGNECAQLPTTFFLFNMRSQHEKSFSFPTTISFYFCTVLGQRYVVKRKWWGKKRGGKIENQNCRRQTDGNQSERKRESTVSIRPFGFLFPPLFSFPTLSFSF